MLPAMPRIPIDEDEQILPIRHLTPFRSAHPLSPPTSGIPELSDDHDDFEVMYSQSYQHLPRRQLRTSQEQDIDLNQVFPDSNRSSEPDLKFKQEDSDTEENGDHRVSRYDTR